MTKAKPKQSRNKFKEMIVELSNSLEKLESFKAGWELALKALAKEYNTDVRMLRRVVKAHSRQNLLDQVNDIRDLESNYRSLFTEADDVIPVRKTRRA